MVLTGALLLRSLGHEAAGRRLEEAVILVLEEGPTTRDIGGTAGTREVARALEGALDRT